VITKQIEGLISPELITTENDTLLVINGVNWSQYDTIFVTNRKPFNLFIQKLYIKKSSQN
jgi:hypothetical protein